MQEAAWASNQIRKIAGCACTGNAGNVFPRHRLQRKPLGSYPGMHHGTCVTHVPWRMSWSRTRGGGLNVPGIPGACAPTIYRIWQEAHCKGIGIVGVMYLPFETSVYDHDHNFRVALEISGNHIAFQWGSQKCPGLNLRYRSYRYQYGTHNATEFTKSDLTLSTSRFCNGTSDISFSAPMAWLKYVNNLWHCFAGDANFFCCGKGQHSMWAQENGD